jgi:hypothetical protein
LLGRVAGRFPRVEPRRRARAFVLGLLADLPRKNCWSIVEHAGDATPDGMQHLLARAVWDEDARHPPPLGLIPLTCNELQHLFAAFVAAPVADTGHRCAGRGGDDDTRPALVAVTTAGKPTDREDHDLRLED